MFELGIGIGLWVEFMSFQTAESHEALLFFEGHQVCKEMLYAEFEAVLDGVVGLTDFANETRKVAYVTFDNHLIVTGCVLFTLEFGGQGDINRSWNLPLRHLEEVAEGGPDLGGGAIRLACKTQCPIPWHQAHLWDPSLGAADNDLIAISHAIERNNLCIANEEQVSSSFGNRSSAHSRPLKVDRREYLSSPASNNSEHHSGAGSDPHPREISSAATFAKQIAASAGQKDVEDDRTGPASKPGLDEQARKRIAGIIRQQRLQVSTLKTERNEQVAALQFSFKEREAELESQLMQQRTLVASLQGQNDAIKLQFESQKNQLKALKLDWQEKFQQKLASRDDQFERFKSEYKELQAQQQQEQFAELKEAVEIKKMELIYRDEINKQLREELCQLRRNKLRLMNSGADQFLDKLDRIGVSFISFHPGAGHLSIPLEDMVDYMEDPTRYAAKKCMVSTDHYRRWLRHHENPSCQCEVTPGNCCNARIRRIEVPNQFASGEHDRCEVHQHGLVQSSSVVKFA